MTIGLSCGRCESRTSLFHTDDGDHAALCRFCFLDLFGRHPSPSAILSPEVHWQNGSPAESSLSKDGPWQLPDGSVGPKFAKETSATSLEQLLNRIEAAAASFEVGLTVHLCHLAEECVAWLHVETMVALSAKLLSSTMHETDSGKSLLRSFLRALAKHSQPCHGSDYVALAGELQLIGLAHGNSALHMRAEEAAESMRGADDLLLTPADLFWVYLTAKAPEKPILEALANLPIPKKPSPNALAAILCGLAQPQVLAVLGAGDLLKIAGRFAKHLVTEANALKLPAQTLPRLALALSDLLLSTDLKVHSEDGDALLKVLRQVAADGFSSDLGDDELADLAVAWALCSSVCRSFWPSYVEDTVATLVSRNSQGSRRFLPGAAVKLLKSIGPVSVGTQGLLGEFYSSRGQWRVWLEDEQCIDAFEEDLELLDEGLRPRSCCHKCWRLSKLTSKHSSKESFSNFALNGIGRCILMVFHYFWFVPI